MYYTFVLVTLRQLKPSFWKLCLFKACVVQMAVATASMRELWDVDEANGVDVGRLLLVRVS